MVNNWLNIIQNSVLPPTCILCNAYGHRGLDLCIDCYNALPRPKHFCSQCAAPLPEDTSTASICGHCQTWPPAFDTTVACLSYQHTAQYLITQLKFNAQYKHARLLGLLLAERLSDATTLPQAIIPVPLHPLRFRERQFNQCIEIGKVVSQQLKIPLLLDSCIRLRDTPQQANLTRKQRLRNLHQAFALNHSIALEHIALLDDVMTTGTTLHELAYVLKKNGVSRVDAWVCARA